MTLPGCHVPAQTVSLSWCEAGCNHCQFDDLLLEDWDTQGAFQYFPNRFTGIDDSLFTITAPEIGMHHVTLNWPWTDNSHLNHQVVKATRPKAGQHGHLGA